MLSPPSIFLRSIRVKLEIFYSKASLIFILIGGYYSIMNHTIDGGKG